MSERCKHLEMQFWSGGHYIYCPQCRSKWVACKIDDSFKIGDGPDAIIDYTRSGTSDVTHDIWTRTPQTQSEEG